MATLFSSTNVWIDKCDFAKIYTQVTPNGLNWWNVLFTTFKYQ